MAGELDSNKIWGRRPNETSLAYANFMAYLRLPPRIRSVEKAFRSVSGAPPDQPVHVPISWWRWCRKHEWVRRVKAYDDLRADEELEKWEARREAARERDWQQAEALRAIVDGALPSATQFFRRNVGQPQGGVPAVVNEAGQIVRQGVPAQVIVTVAFDVVGMTNVLKEASRIQRLTANEPTDNINNLTGAALDAALERALGQWALENIPDSDEARDAPQAPDPEASPEEDFDDGADE